MTDGGRATPGNDDTVPSDGETVIGDVTDGRTRSGHYEDVVLIGEGGMGRISSAWDRRLRRKIAIKELRTDTLDLRARFEREALLTARLQHPSIVSVYEAGQWRSGEPYYAMRLVPGQPLDRVIAEATSLPARLALVPHVLAVADALAYAHSERVIHRDLKPHNVLVGSFGETVVIDWGLAKDLADGDPEAHVLGTPAYMPPEQAEGRAVDERADVYAIGAILYHLLAGGAPYDGGSSDEILASVKRGPPRPLGEVEAGAPSDLLAVVARAMMRDPADRYPSARELADDLRRFQAGLLVGAHRYTLRERLGRWLRRHRAAVVVAAVAVIVVAAGATLSIGRILAERRHAEAERRAAVASRADAEELMDFMLGDLRDRLEPVGKLELLDVVARKARDYYRGRPDTRDPGERRRRLLAFQNVGDVLAAQGDTDGAIAEHREAIALAEELAAAAPGEADAQRDLETAHRKYGDVLWVRGDAVAALGEFRAQRSIAEELGTPAGIASARIRIGDVLLAQGDTEGALAEYDACRAIHQARVAATPTDPDAQRELSVAHEVVGDARRVRGDVAGALAEYRAALAIRRELVEHDPENADHLRDLSIAHEKVGTLLLLFQRETGPALIELRASLAIRERQAAADPGNADRQRDLSFAHQSVGDVLYARGEPKAAAAEHQASVAICERLAAVDPRNGTWSRDLAYAHMKAGDSSRDQGELDGALVHYRAMLEAAQTAVDREPTHTLSRTLLGVAHQRIGLVLLARDDAAGALAEFRAEQPIQDALVAEDPDNAEVARNRAVNLGKIGDALFAQRDLPGALAEYKTGLAQLEVLSAADPSNLFWLADLGVAVEKIGSVLELQGDAKAAREAYRRALDIVERRAAADPENARTKVDLARLRKKLSAT